LLARLRSAWLVAIVASGAALALDACGASTPSSPGPCGAPKGQVVVAYPAPGATAIPDNVAGVIFASTDGLSGGYQAWLLPYGSSEFLEFAPVATVTPPLPAPNMIPTFPNPVYQESASAGVVLPADTEVGVYLNDSNSYCSPRLLSTFTTQ